MDTFFPPPRSSERLPLAPQHVKGGSKRLHGGLDSSVRSAIQDYEIKLSQLERAMKDLDGDEVRRLAKELNFLSEDIKDVRGLAAYLEKGRYGSVTRKRLEREYIDRYVMLRGGAFGTPRSGRAYTGEHEDHEFMEPGTIETFSELTETAVRHGFVQKVYGILAVQLVITTLVASGIMALIETTPVLASVCLVLSLVMLISVMCVMCCNSSLMTNYPLNYIILALFTLAESVLVGFIGAQYTKESILIVTAITAVVVIALSIFACQTSYDITGWGPYLLVALICLSGLSFLMLLGVLVGFGNSPAFQTVNLIFAALGAMLFSFYIVYDTQLIVGGKHTQVQFPIDQYCMAALTLYMDIVQLFIHLLQLFGDRK